MLNDGHNPLGDWLAAINKILPDHHNVSSTITHGGWNQIARDKEQEQRSPVCPERIGEKGTLALILNWTKENVSIVYALSVCDR